MSEAASVASEPGVTAEVLERIRNEEYKIWKKQSPFLYDVCVSKAMPSPSASVQWFPARQPYTTSTESPAFDRYTLLLSSSKLLGGANAVYKGACDLPRPDASAEDISNYGHKHSGLTVVETSAALALGDECFPYSARYSPLNPQLIACCGKDGFAKVFKDDVLHADLVHHSKDVYDLSWSPHKESDLVTVSTDGTAAVWDAAAASSSPKQVFAGDNSIGEAENASQALYTVQHAPLNPNELVTAGDSRTVQFWDLRTSLEKPIRYITDAHAAAITALDYSPLNEMLLATGSADGAVSLWDVRMSSASLVALHAHTGVINSLRWSPHEESVFATGGADAQVKVWDLSMHGRPQTAAEEEEGPPELIFIHGGHLDAISDFSWHPTLPYTLCSVSEDSLVGIWKIASAIIDAADDDEEKKEEPENEN